jgi:putative ABC transport system substrate-binding protein
MNRREVITLLGGAAAWQPVAAWAQQPDRLRRVGVLMASAADDPVSQARIAALRQGLSQWGWTEDRNVRIETRWATTNGDDLRRHAAELVALAPDVLVSIATNSTAFRLSKPNSASISTHCLPTSLSTAR